MSRKNKSLKISKREQDEFLANSHWIRDLSDEHYLAFLELAAKQKKERENLLRKQEDEIDQFVDEYKINNSNL